MRHLFFYRISPVPCSGSNPNLYERHACMYGCSDISPKKRGTHRLWWIPLCFFIYIGSALRIQGTGFASNTFLLFSFEMDIWISSVCCRLYFFRTSII